MSVRSDVEESANFFIGEDRVLEYTVLDAAAAAVNITGWAMEWVLRLAASSSGNALLTKTVGAGITITNGAGGVCQVALADDDTLALSPGDLTYALRRTDAGAEAVLAFGTFALRQAATR